MGGIKGSHQSSPFDLHGFKVLVFFEIGGIPGEDDVIFPVLQCGGKFIGCIPIAHQ